MELAKLAEIRENHDPRHESALCRRRPCFWAVLFSRIFIQYFRLDALALTTFKIRPAMNVRRPLFATLSCLAALGVFAGAARAQNVTTDPVGAVTLTLKGGSDTDISLPFHRPVALETQVQSITSNGSTNSDITVSASANITGNQFVYVSGSQSNTYYLQFTSGNRAGSYYTVTANGNTSITVNNNNDTGLVGNVSTSDTFRVIPYWTLNTLFPNGQSLYSTNTLTPQSSILVSPTTTPGINLSAAAIYYYYNDGDGTTGWLKLGDDSDFFPDVPLSPDSSFVVRHPASTSDTQLVLVGNVPMSAQSVVINTLAPNTPQDNAIALPLPVSVTLGNSGLQNVLASTNSLTPVDSLLVFDPTVVAQNKSATAIYYYYNDGQGTTGWLKLGDDSNFYDSSTIFQPGYGYIIRRAGQSSPTSTVWTYTPPYLTP
jgi:uncharacterized protein (TIGR02597 family)